MKAVNEYQHNTRDCQQKAKIVSQNRTKRKIITGRSQEGRHADGYKINRHYTRQWCVGCYDCRVDAVVDAELNEEHYKDYRDVELSHEDHEHGEACNDASEGATPFHTSSNRAWCFLERNQTDAQRFTSCN